MQKTAFTLIPWCILLGAYYLYACAFFPQIALWSELPIDLDSASSRYFQAIVGISLLFVVAASHHHLARFSEPTPEAARLFCLTDITDHKTAAGEEKWVEHYSVSTVKLNRPKQGLRTEERRCPNCGVAVSIEVRSDSRALRNRMFFAATIGVLWLFPVVQAEIGFGKAGQVATALLVIFAVPWFPMLLAVRHSGAMYNPLLQDTIAFPRKGHKLEHEGVSATW